MNIKGKDLLRAQLVDPNAQVGEDVRLISSNQLKFYNSGSGDYWTLDFNDDLVFTRPAGTTYGGTVALGLASGGTNNVLGGQWALENQNYEPFNGTGDAGVVNVGHLKSFVQDAIANIPAAQGLVINDMYYDADAVILETNQGQYSADISSLRTQTTEFLDEAGGKLFFTPARVLTTLLAGYAPATTNRSLAATDTVNGALGVLEKRVNDTAAIVAAQQTALSGAISVTYAQLTTMMTNSQLLPTRWYLITDYRTVHTIYLSNPATTNTGGVEAILVQAVTVKTLAATGFSTVRPREIIYYNPANDQTIQPGCVYGFIYRRIDSLFGNDFPFDWYVYKFRRWADYSTTTTAIPSSDSSTPATYAIDGFTPPSQNYGFQDAVCWSAGFYAGGYVTNNKWLMAPNIPFSTNFALKLSGSLRNTVVDNGKLTIFTQTQCTLENIRVTAGSSASIYSYSSLDNATNLKVEDGSSLMIRFAETSSISQVNLTNASSLTLVGAKTTVSNLTLSNGSSLSINHTNLINPQTLPAVFTCTATSGTFDIFLDGVLV